MSLDRITRSRAALTGAIVADAATLGWHWMYDPAHITATLEKEGKNPEFYPPLASVFEGHPAYFAHEAKKLGDVTHYGAHALASFKTLAAKNGKWDNEQFITDFTNTFSAGGSWVGYIDGSTNATIQNLKEDAEKVAVKAADHAELEGDHKSYFITYIPKKAAGANGEELGKAIASVFEARFHESDKAELAAAVEKAKKGAKFYEENITKTPGADDNQVGALAKIPAVVVANVGAGNLLEIVESAVRQTHNNDEAVAYALYAAKVLDLVLQGKAIPEALAAAVSVVEGKKKEVKEGIEKALADKAKQGAAGEKSKDDINEAPDDKVKRGSPAVSLRQKVADEKKKAAGEQLAKDFGMPSPLEFTFPLSVAILNRDLSFVDATRLNIHAAGDNAGRAIFIGSVLGAAYGIDTTRGIPLTWAVKVRDAAEILEMIDEATRTTSGGQ